jgi:ABC-2 type transport system ATP-binding protein
MNTVLSVRGLSKTYRRRFSRHSVVALKGIGFDIYPGTITGFLGANGSGKTTTLKCLLELAFADAGEIKYFGQETPTRGLTPEIKRKIGFLPERPYFYEYLTGREFLRFYGELSRRLSRADLNTRINELLERVGLTEAGDRALRGYSKGMLQRIGIAQALIHNPEFVILDEPMTGLDPDGRQDVREIIRETARTGTAVFFSSHLLPDAEQLCERLVILQKGELRFDGKTSDLLSRFENGYRLKYRQGETEKVETLADVAALQAAIDSLRATGREILEVHPLRRSLEEAFAELSVDSAQTKERR